MRPRPVVARWPTSLALLALLAAGCGHEPSRSPSGGATASPRLAAVQQQPLRVKGTGFRPRERVELTAKGLRSAHASATADAAGSFTATFRGLARCDSVTVVASGSKGSRASFNLSQIACTDA